MAQTIGLALCILPAILTNGWALSSLSPPGKHSCNWTQDLPFRTNLKSYFFLAILSLDLMIKFVAGSGYPIIPPLPLHMGTNVYLVWNMNEYLGQENKVQVLCMINTDFSFLTLLLIILKQYFNPYLAAYISSCPTSFKIHESRSWSKAMFGCGDSK